MVSCGESRLHEAVEVATHLLRGYAEASSQSTEAGLLPREDLHYAYSFLVADLEHHIVEVIAAHLGAPSIRMRLSAKNQLYLDEFIIRRVYEVVI